MGSTAKGRTPPTSRKSWQRSNCARSETASRSHVRRGFAEGPLRRVEQRPEGLSGGPAQGPGWRIPTACQAPRPSWQSHHSRHSRRSFRTRQARDFQPRWPLCASTTLLRDKELGEHIMPIVPDESRTFGMEGLFRSIGIYNPAGQHYTPEDESRCPITAKQRMGRSCRKASTRPVPWPTGSQQQHPIPITACPR